MVDGGRLDREQVDFAARILEVAPCVENDIRRFLGARNEG